MSNQEAIEILKIERDHMVPTLLPERIEAMDMAISALQAQEGEQMRLTKKIKEQIIALHHQGKTVRQISDILNIAEAMVVRVISPRY